MNNVDQRVLFRVQVKEEWNLSWVTVNFLEPLECDWSMAPRISRAMFRYRFGKIMAENSSEFLTRNQRTDLADNFVRIQTMKDDGEDRDFETYWVGVIRDDATIIESYEDEGHQIFTAFGLESLFQTVFIETATALNKDNEAIIIDHVPAFNRKSKRTRTILGNRSDTTAGDPLHYIFANAEQMDLNLKWSNKDIAEYLVYKHKPEGIDWQFLGQLNALELIKEVHHLRPENGRTTLWDAMNKIIDNKRGYSWFVDARDLDESGTVYIRIQTLVNEDLSYLGDVLPANDRITPFIVDSDFPFSHLTEAIQYRRTTVHKYDRIVVQGQPIRVMATFSYDGEELERGWNLDEENEYIDAKGTTDPEEGDQWRLQDRFEDIYRAHRVKSDWDGKVTSLIDGTKYPAVPDTDEDGNVSLLTEPGDFWNGQKHFCRDLLILAGYDYSVSPPVKTGEEKTDDEFRPMMVWVTDTSGESPHGATGKWLWVDKLARPLTRENIDDNSLFQSAHVRPLDKHMGFHLGINPGHYYGLKHSPADMVTDTDPEFDYKDLAVTASFVTDKRQYISRELTSPMPSTPRTLVYTVRGAEYWWVVPDTIIDVDEKGQPIPVDFGNKDIRNDYPLLKATATLLEAWYGQERQAVRVTVRRVEEFAELGELWESINSAGFQPQPVNTVVTSIHTDFTEKNNGVTIETGYDDLDYIAIFDKGEGGGAEHDASPGDEYPLSQLPLRLAKGVSVFKPHKQYIEGSLRENLDVGSIASMDLDFPIGGEDTIDVIGHWFTARKYERIGAEWYEDLEMYVATEKLCPANAIGNDEPYSGNTSTDPGPPFDPDSDPGPPSECPENWCAYHYEGDPADWVLVGSVGCVCPSISGNPPPGPDESNWLYTCCGP